MTTIGDRYLVGCAQCGHVLSFYGKADAMDVAMAHRRTHADVRAYEPLPSVTVFDRMARRGAPDTWEVVGSGGHCRQIRTRPLRGSVRERILG